MINLQKFLTLANDLDEMAEFGNINYKFCAIDKDRLKILVKNKVNSFYIHIDPKTGIFDELRDTRMFDTIIKDEFLEDILFDYGYKIFCRDLIEKYNSRKLEI